MATFVHMPQEGDAGAEDPAIALARHVKAIQGQDPIGVDKISDSQVRRNAQGGLWVVEGLGLVVSEAAQGASRRGGVGVGVECFGAWSVASLCRTAACCSLSTKYYACVTTTISMPLGRWYPQAPISTRFF